MKTLVAFTLLVAAALADPQVYVPGVSPYAYTPYAYGTYGAYGVSPYTATYPYVGVKSPAVVSPLAYSVGTPAVTYPVQDTSRGIPQPVQDTPEVKFAKSAFAAEYAATVSRNTGAVAVPVHNIHKRAAQVFPVVSAYKTPASTSPLVYSAYTAPVVSTPYVSTYNYGGYYPYSYPYVY